MLTGRLSSKRREEFQEPAINVTPLIDVVFVLLISFIIVAPLLETDSVDLAPSGGLETHRPIRSQDQSPITIHVLKDNTIMIGNKRVLLSNLSSVILNLKQQYPKAKPQLFHDKRASFGTYQEIKNCLESLGFTELDIVLSPS